jgi:hypothetical protein
VAFQKAGAHRVTLRADPVLPIHPQRFHRDRTVGIEVIGAAMAEAGIAAMGRLTLSRHERMVMVEPRGSGMALFTLRAAEEVTRSAFTAIGPSG